MKSKSILSTVALLAAVGLFSVQADAKRTSPPITLAELLLKHQKATASSEVSKDVSGLQVEYQVEASGLTGSLQESDLPPHKSRAEFNFGPLHQIMGDNGITAWQQDSSGNVRVIQGSELAEQRASSSFSLENFDPFQDKSKAQVTLEPQTEPGTGDYVIDVLPKGGMRESVYIDPHTFLIQKSVVHVAGMVATTRILKYQKVSGEQVPAKMEVGYAGLPMTLTFTLTKAQRGMQFDPGYFDPPVTETKDYEFLAPAPNGQVTLPFTNEHNEIVIPITINGHPLRFLLDSGAGASFLISQTAGDLGLTLQGNFPAMGYGGSSRTGIATKTTIELPNAIRIKGQLLYALQDPKVAAALKAKAQVDGGLGYDLLARFAVTVDYTAKTITLTDPDQFQAPTGPGVVALPISLATRVPTVRGAIDGKTEGAFLIDSGDSGSVRLFEKYAAANGLVNQASDPNARQATGVGVGGTITEIVTPGHTLKLGEFTASNVPVSTSAGSGLGSVSENAGGIGNGLLSQYRVTFDYRHALIYLEPKVASAHDFHVQTVAETKDAKAPQTLAELLDRHAAAMGGRPALEAIKSTRTTATLTTGGAEGTVSTFYQSPDKEYEEDKLGLIQITQGYDGTVAWRRDSNGNIRLLAGEEIKDLRNQIFTDTNSYVLPGHIPSKMTLRPDIEPGTGNYIVDALPEGGKPLTLFFDPKTFLIVKQEQLEDDVLTTTTFSDYQTADGVQFPTRQHVTNGNARYDIELKVSKIENNVDVPGTLFQKPSLLKNFSFVKPGATSATVPFDTEDDEIGIMVTINGHPEHMFLDTGAGGIALSRKEADALKLAQGGFLEARGYGGSTDFRPIQIHTFEVTGAVKLQDITGVAIALPEVLNQFLTRPAAGFVGYDLLTHFVVRLDFAHHRLTFIDPDTFQPAASDGPSLPLELDADVPAITAQLDGLPPARFLLDTGDVGALRLFGPYVAQNHLRKQYPNGVATTGGGIGGASEAFRTKTRSLTVAGVTLKGVPTDFSLDTKGGASLVNAGSLGSELLSRFIVTFDYPHARVFLAPQSGTTLPFDTRTFGLTAFERHDARGHRHLVIGSVDPQAPIAEVVGPGMEILSINGQDAAKLSLNDVRQALGGGDGTKKTITLVVTPTIGHKRTVNAPLFDPLDSKGNG